MSVPLLYFMKSDSRSLNSVHIAALFTAASVTVYLLELMLPRPLPFFKIGLANIFVLILLTNHYAKIGFIVTVAKSIIGGFFSGLLISPTTLFSLGGGLTAYGIMLCFFYSKIRFSIIGISILGAVFHNLAQLVLVYYTLIHETSLFLLLPLLILLGIVTGSVSGYFAHLLNKKSLFLMKSLG